MVKGWTVCSVRCRGEPMCSPLPCGVRYEVRGLSLRVKPATLNTIELLRSSGTTGRCAGINLLSVSSVSLCWTPIPQILSILLKSRFRQSAPNFSLKKFRLPPRVFKILYITRARPFFNIWTTRCVCVCVCVCVCYTNFWENQVFFKKNINKMLLIIVDKIQDTVFHIFTHYYSDGLELCGENSNFFKKNKEKLKIVIKSECIKKTVILRPNLY